MPTQPVGTTGSAGMDPEILKRWFERLKERDPKLHAELSSRLSKRVKKVAGPAGLESTTLETTAPPLVHATLETIVREGRPALLVRDGRITREDTVIDDLSKEIVGRLVEAAPAIEPIIPLVGRIDVANFAGNADYLGTGWLIETDVVVTNRHVANLVSRWDGGLYRFRLGRFGDPLQVTIDYRHELGRPARDVAEITEVIFIEPDDKKADIAFLRVKRRSDGSRQDRIQLSEIDAAPGAGVAVVGYPARAPAHIIPDQAWMDRIYGSTYDVKRVAPGLMDQPSRGWATHDCTTLGGNSGSVVIDMKSGRAVALHFAGLYMIENYAVPASTIRDYIKRQPWHRGSAVGRESRPAPAPRPAPPPASPPASAVRKVEPTDSGSGAVSIEIPIKITIAYGQPNVTIAQSTATVATLPKGTTEIDEAVRTFAHEHRGGGVLAVRAGYVFADGQLTDTDCIVVAAHPERLQQVRAAVPPVFSGHPVAVRPASIDDQLGTSEEAITAEAASSVMYDDESRTGPGFSFAEVDEQMSVTCHVGPERSWEVLKTFLDGTQRELISSMYEFHAEHIAEAVEGALAKGASMQLVLDPKTRDPKKGDVDEGDFDRSETFADWADRFEFERIFVPLGGQGLVATSYHIKVTVRDRNTFWLSSGNWKHSSQPVIAAADRLNPNKTGAAGNREWHVVIENDKLADRFRNHIIADYDQAKALGGKLEAVADEMFVDVPLTILEAIALEAPPAEVIEPLVINRGVRVKPLLTPDKKGAVFSDAVLKLIRSAKKQLVFQNQYIKMDGASSGYLKKLVDLLVKKSNEIDDFRMILRSDVSGFWDNVEALKKRGMDVSTCVRRLPKVHTKGIVVDGKRVLIGSHNWSASGVTLNRDASLIFEDEEVAKYFLHAFDVDWDRAGELTELEAMDLEAPRLAAPGTSVPAGFKRMTLSEYMEG